MDESRSDALERALALAEAAAGGDQAALDAYLVALKTRDFGRGVHFGSYIGIEVVDVQSDRVTMRMPWRRELRRGGGIFHGGAIMALADHVAGCLFNTDPRVFASRSTGLTTDFTMSFLRAADPGEALVATGTVLRRGRNLTFMQIDVRGESSGRVVATCRTTYLLVPRDKVRGATARGGAGTAGGAHGTGGTGGMGAAGGTPGGTGGARG